MRRAARPLTEDRRALAAEHWPYARSLARPFRARLPRLRDEFESAAALGLVEAALTFEPGRGAKFSTYARHRVIGRLRSLWRSQVNRRVDLPILTEPSRIEPDQLDQVDALEHWLRRLPSRYASVCRLIYRDGLTQAEASRAIGLAPPRINAIHRQSLTLLEADLVPHLRR